MKKGEAEKYVRYMVTGVRVSDGKTLTGFLSVMPDGDVYIFPPDGYDSADNYLIADKHSIEPLSAAVLKNPIYDNGEGGTVVDYSLNCPYCQRIFDWEDWGCDDYCCECGQRLNWSGVQP